MRTARISLFSLLLVLGTACGFAGGDSRSAATSKPAATTAAESSPDTSGIQVTDAKLAKDFTYGDVVNPTNTFYPTDRAFHLVVDLSNPPEGTRVGAVWYAVDAGSFKNDKLDSETYTLKTGEERVHVSLTNKENWPKGKYKVQVMLNGKINRTLDFQVK